jgi:O-acetyl-ADP-ribose deacetylase (regulator of RNase III)
MDNLTIVLADIEMSLANAWKMQCEDLPFVEIYHGSIFDVKCDAVVSPANSFGFIDGGIDLYYSQYFGWDVEKNLQEIIRTKYHGELLVGQAEIVETNHEKIPYLISAPTMRVPMVLRESVNPYLATRAVLLLIQHGHFADGTPISERVQRVAFPGLGTGVGRVGPMMCAHQMRQAIDSVALGTKGFPKTWPESQNHHLSLVGTMTSS